MNANSSSNGMRIAAATQIQTRMRTRIAAATRMRVAGAQPRLAVAINQYVLKFLTRREALTNKKGSFDKMLADGANAQNNAITQSSGKAAVSMAATNLNIGMDLWNASSAEADAPKLRNNQPAPGAVNPPTIMGCEVALGEQWIQDERDLKRQKRKQSNRESARRSRLRKQVLYSYLHASNG
ncbi:uncharacterized protein [Arachis hypogaea]|uniref:uncharacterized protein n=1 Tax=Arachis hypogaea TaxID=3818 RepID=UPI003B20ED00